MYYKKYIIVILIVFGINKSMAQQEPNYTLYRYAMNLINPAYAGSDKQASLGINLRSQWVNIERAPQTQSVFFGTSLGDKVGLGLSIINDETFIENQTYIALDFSYHIQIDAITNIFLGLKTGINSYNANTNSLLVFDTFDPSLTNIDGRHTPNIGVGVLFKRANYYLSFSIPKILNTERINDTNGEAILGKSKTHFYFSAGYDIKLKENLVLKPSFLTRHINNAPISIDVTASFLFHEKFEVGLSYRLDEALGGLAIFNFQDWLNIGYAYESSTINSIENNGTHEIYTRFKF